MMRFALSLFLLSFPLSADERVSKGFGRNASVARFGRSRLKRRGGRSRFESAFSVLEG